MDRSGWTTIGISGIDPTTDGMHASSEKEGFLNSLGSVDHTEGVDHSVSGWAGWNIPTSVEPLTERFDRRLVTSCAWKYFRVSGALVFCIFLGQRLEAGPLRPIPRTSNPQVLLPLTRQFARPNCSERGAIRNNASVAAGRASFGIYRDWRIRTRLQLPEEKGECL